MADTCPAVDRRLDRLRELDLAVDDRAVREPYPQRRGLGIRARGYLDELEHDQLIDEAVGVLRQEEPAVLDDPELGQLDLGRMLQPEASDRSDREAGDARHDPMLADRHVP